MSVREGLLALLEDGARNGHQLKVEFEAATGGVWPLNVGQVYQTLDRLERDGLVARAPVGDEGTEKRRYELTRAGRDELASWWRVVPGDDPPPRDELMLKVLMAAATGDRDHALAVITEQRSALLSRLQARRRAARDGRDAHDDIDPVSAMVDDALVVRAEADLRWLDLCEARVLARKGAMR
jgi:DNA-binding PadR family transcriptional regulator